MKPKALPFILAGIIVILAAGLIWALIYIRNIQTPLRGVAPLIEVAAMEPDSSVWGVNFPNQYSTFLLTRENQERTAYGGSLPFDRLEWNPRLVTLFAGMAFSVEYNEDRGHMWSLEDVREIARTNDDSAGTCYSCKSADNPRLWAEMGPAEYFSTPFGELGQQIDHPIGCANCHETDTMRLIVTNPALENALQAQGKDWQNFTRQEMRSVVCANCHVEYYFEPETDFLIFPWQNGTRIEEIAQYFEEIDFSDYVHGVSGAPMIKMQHPEYEMYTADSTHYRAGVACADCHMPYKRDGASKFSDHNVRSPLLNPQAACGTCHTDVEYVTGRVGVIQSQVFSTMVLTEEAIIEAIYAIEAAASLPGVDASFLEEARWLHRESQLRWDFISAENSMGFHNSSEALRILAVSMDLARQAQIKALLATGE
ncbi:MAG: ammonia-forming cytochrome c nitrite reductase subunit c552 [Anaerolineales bacterium]|nr:ammonia-forming cytochrome c nitrite reductase subunit c552 [Anaerolineales bacterium]